MNLSNPDNTFYVMEDYGIDHNNVGDEPERVFFSSLVSQVATATVYYSLQVAYGQRSLLHQYSVKSRIFIGNTSMDAQLSFLMANQAKVGMDNVGYWVVMATLHRLLMVISFVILLLEQEVF